MIYTVKESCVVTIREANENDAQKLLESAKANILEQEFIITSPEEFNLTVAQEKLWIKSFQESPSSLLLIAVVDNNIVGNIVLRGNPRKKLSHSAEIGMGVTLEYRNLGIGKLLLEEAIKWASQHEQIERLTLQVFANNSRAIHLYHKLGFQEEGRQLKAIKVQDSEYIDNVLMCKTID